MFDELDLILFCVIAMCIHAIFELLTNDENKKEK